MVKKNSFLSKLFSIFVGKIVRFFHSLTLTAIIESRTYKIESNRIILKNIFIFAKWKTMFITSKLTSIGN
jgi:hypothetical protein